MLERRARRTPSPFRRYSTRARRARTISGRENALFLHETTFIGAIAPSAHTAGVGGLRNARFRPAESVFNFLQQDVQRPDLLGAVRVQGGVLRAHGFNANEEFVSQRAKLVGAHLVQIFVVVGHRFVSVRRLL
jgi:hypothetical protein